MEDENIFFQTNNTNYNLSQKVNILGEDSGIRERKYQSTEYSTKKFLKYSEYETFSLENIINYTQKLIKVNKEFLIIIVYILISFFIMLIELLYGLINSHVDIISDSFFNIFKTSAFLITALSILLSKYFNYLNFLTGRIELIAALSNSVFLMIVSLYQILESLNSISENDDNSLEANSIDKKTLLVNFLRTFGVFKIILDTSFVLFFSDYMIHPSIQIRLQLWKKYRSWKRFEDLNIVDLKENNELIKNWNNHVENMNALMMNIVCDLFTNIVLLISYDFSHMEHYEKINLIVCFVKLFFTLFCITPLLNSILQVLMQGKSSFFQCFFDHLEKEISLFEGVLAIQQIKFWMVAQNEIRCNMKLLVNTDINKIELKNQLDTIVNNFGVNIDMIIDTSIAHS